MGIIEDLQRLGETSMEAEIVKDCRLFFEGKIYRLGGKVETGDGVYNQRVN
jgi:hypothetical protein